MLILLSPAKRLDLERPPITPVLTEPALLSDAERLMARAKKLSPKKLQALMGISPALAELNHQRFQQMVIGGPPADARQAVMAFNGDVYLGLDAPSLSEADLHYAQEHLAILSGLYGLLRPLDAMQPYRLEMGSALKTRRGRSLYSFWGGRITRAINEHLADHEDPTVVNLASSEYFKSVQPKTLAGPLVTPVFKELHNGTLKVISFNAKKARGLMARWIITNRVDRAARLLDFTEQRYTHQPTLGTPDRPVFTREFIPAGAG